jgi:hypothetical protein
MESRKLNSLLLEHAVLLFWLLEPNCGNYMWVARGVDVLCGKVLDDDGLTVFPIVTDILFSFEGVVTCLISF